MEKKGKVGNKRSHGVIVDRTAWLRQGKPHAFRFLPGFDEKLKI
jgi:hypothetical protein